MPICYPGVASHQGYVKVGYTERDVETRVAEQMHTSAVPYQIVLEESAMRPDGSCFTDKDVHAALRTWYSAVECRDDRNEWFKCSVDIVRAAIIAVRDGTANIENRTQTFKMLLSRRLRYSAQWLTSSRPNVMTRPRTKVSMECQDAFGKTFASYELAKKMGFTRVLVLTFKPAVDRLDGRLGQPCGF
jgi:hypothetical protein